MSQAPSMLLAAISAAKPESRELLLFWLASDPAEVQEYVNVTSALIQAGELNLARLVVDQGLASFAQDDSLSLLALRLDINPGLPLAA